MVRWFKDGGVVGGGGGGLEAYRSFSDKKTSHEFIEACP